MNVVDGLGRTALHRASQVGQVQCCHLLLSYGADPSIVALDGTNAAQVAAEPVLKILEDGSISANQGTDTEYQLLEGAKAGDMELVKKICSGMRMGEKDDFVFILYLRWHPHHVSRKPSRTRF